MRNTVIDLILLTIPFVLIFLIALSQVSNNYNKIMRRMHLKLILLVVAVQIFGSNLIMIRNSREIIRIMSPEALQTLKIPESILSESDLSFGYFFLNDEFIAAYSVIFFLTFSFAFWLVFLKKRVE